jgi:hypothetical protein
VRRYVDRPGLSKRLIVEEPAVNPPGPCVEGSSARVERNNRKPRLAEAIIRDLLLCGGQELLGDTAPPVFPCDIDLLYFITHDHHEPGDGSTNRGNGRIADSFGGSPLKRIGSPRRYQFVWDPTKMGIKPTSAPDLSHVRGIAGSCGAQKNQPFMHSTIPTPVGVL